MASPPPRGGGDTPQARTPPPGRRQGARGPDLVGPEFAVVIVVDSAQTQSGDVTGVSTRLQLVVSGDAMSFRRWGRSISRAKVAWIFLITRKFKKLNFSCAIFRRQDSERLKIIILNAMQSSIR